LKKISKPNQHKSKNETLQKITAMDWLGTLPPFHTTWSSELRIDFTVSTKDEDVRVEGYVFYKVDPIHIHMFLLQGKDIDTAYENMDAKFLTRSQRLIEDECAGECSDSIVGKTSKLENRLKDEWTDRDDADKKQYGVDITSLDIGNVDYSDEVKKARNASKVGKLYGEAARKFAEQANQGESDKEKHITRKQARDSVFLAEDKPGIQEVIVTSTGGSGGGSGTPPIVIVHADGGGKPKGKTS
jgi:regulator of protease activity HflC (stomatin/prohibitin superfamily)